MTVVEVGFQIFYSFQQFCNMLFGNSLGMVVSGKFVFQKKKKVVSGKFLTCTSITLFEITYFSLVSL